MPRRISLVAFLVSDYDQAIAWFTRALGFTLLEDTPCGDGKRWVRVAPSSSGATALLLARAVTDEQRAVIGRQGGGRVYLFMETADLDGDMVAMRAQGVHFTETPRDEEYGRVVVFEDLYGNRWDLVQPVGVDK